MRTRVPVLATILGLVAVLAATGTAFAQADTAQAAQMRRMGRGMMGGAHMMGRMAMRGPHTGPRMLVNLKQELELSDDQVARLEAIHEEHQVLMQAQMERLREHREAAAEARAEGDYDALERLIDEGADLHKGMARGILDVERRSMAVLTDAQREKFDTWREGARLFHRSGRHGMRGHGMRGRGMQQRQRLHQPPPPGS